MVRSDVEENVNEVKGQGLILLMDRSLFSCFITTDFTSSLTRCMTLVTTDS